MAFSSGGLTQSGAQARSADPIATVGPDPVYVFHCALCCAFAGAATPPAADSCCVRAALLCPPPKSGHAPPPSAAGEQEGGARRGMGPVLFWGYPGSRLRRFNCVWMAFSARAGAPHILRREDCYTCSRFDLERLPAAARMRRPVPSRGFCDAPALREPGTVFRGAAGARCRPAL